MWLLATRVKWLIIGVFLLLALLPCPVYASTQEADTLPLTISEVSDSNIGYHSATISWKTNDNATSQVFYDTVSHNTTAEYAYHTTEDTALVSEHSVRLTGLSSGRTYHYRVRSATVIDGSDFIAISEDYTFRTSLPPPPRYYIDTNLFGIEKSYRISRTGEILKTIEATSADGNLTITIPEGTIALDKDGKRLASLETAVNESPPDPPEEASIIGLAYDFWPAGAMFSPPITLSWNHDVLPEGVAEVVIAYYDEEAGEWVELDGVVDTENNTITASVAYFTTFAVIGRVPAPALPEPAPPEEEEVPIVVTVVEEEEEEGVIPLAPAAFSVSSLAVGPARVKPGESVTVSIVIANTGGEPGSYTVVLKITAVKEAEETITIAGGESQDVSFSVTREDPGNYTVDVDGLSGSFTVVALVNPVGVDWPLIGGIIGGQIVAGLLIYFLVFRRRAY